MSLYVKQDFTPTFLSRKWITTKFRSNILLKSRDHMLAILESGLMFREDSATVEQEVPSLEELWKGAGGRHLSWLTGGERTLAALGIGACVALFPPHHASSRRSFLMHLCVYTTIPLAIRVCHRLASSGGALQPLLKNMKDYMSVLRRTMACLKEFKLLGRGLESISSLLDTTMMLLWRQQSELTLTMARCSSAILGNFPWLRDDVAWEHALTAMDNFAPTEADLVKVHHAFLVVQSTLLKHIGMSHTLHFNVKNHYSNHNERLYWLHNVLLESLNEEFKHNFESLERTYRLLKNHGTKDTDTPKISFTESRTYSGIHSDITRATIELKVALTKCSSLDMFLDSCALNNHDLNLESLGKDVDEMVLNVTKCLDTLKDCQIRVNKLGGFEKPVVVMEDIDEIAAEYSDEEDEPRMIQDEVFYDENKGDEDFVPAKDLTTGPGMEEREVLKGVIKELRGKLVVRENMMLERERRALVKKSGHYRNNIPEILKPKVISKGFIAKIRKENPSKVSKVAVKIRKNQIPPILPKNTTLCSNTYVLDVKESFESRLEPDTKYTIVKSKQFPTVCKWRKIKTDEVPESMEMFARILGNGPRWIHKSDTDKDVDEKSLPFEYNLDTGLALASALRKHMGASVLEEVYFGDD